MPQPSSRLRASWSLLRNLLLAFAFCALYVAVDLRLADTPPPALTWKRIIIGAAVWLVVALAIGTTARAGERAAGDR